jgi:hypothetical protein
MFSVTRILRETANMSALNNWVAKVGQDEAERVKQKGLERGLKFDYNLQQYFKSGVISDCPLFQQAWHVLSDFDRHLYSEKFVIHTLGFSGRLDYLGKLADKTLRLVDWKTASSSRSEDWMTDAKLQTVAYIKAAENSLDIKIDSGEVVVCVEDGEIPQRFPIFKEDIDPLFEQFLERFERFKEDNVQVNSRW